jgi:hypothetical protein
MIISSAIKPYIIPDWQCDLALWKAGNEVNSGVDPKRFLHQKIGSPKRSNHAG